MSVAVSLRRLFLDIRVQLPTTAPEHEAEVEKIHLAVAKRLNEKPG